MILRITAIIASILVVVVASSVVYVKTALPNVGDPQDLKIEYTAERIARGEYLAKHVMQCVECHAERDFSKFAGPVVAGTEGRGGEVFDQRFGFPGSFVARNITPYGIGDWTDGELFRAITTGVSKDGSALFPIMPYLHYGQCDPEDIKAEIAYLRTLEPIEKDHPSSKADFPVNLLINTMPKNGTPLALPAFTDEMAYGKYLTTAAVCSECHTNSKEGKQIGEPFSGGFEFAMGPFGTVRSPNITPHETGIGSWTKEDFIARFKQYADSTHQNLPALPGQMQTIMPWVTYSGMTEKDLGAIYTYLRSVKPVENTVVRYSPPA